MVRKTGLTRRQRIKQLLRDRQGVRPTAISASLYDDGVTLSVREVIDELGEIKRSLGEREQLYVSPARCRDCGFHDWDSLLNIPSRCPEKDCRSEWIEEPEFKIES